MQKRHRHFIRRVTQCRYPQCIVAVAAEVNSRETPASESMGASDHIYWSAATATLKQGDVTSLRIAVGASSQEWWEYCSSLLRHTPAILIVSWGAWENSINLGFWERLEDGRIYLRGIDPRSLDSKTIKGHRGNAGYWVIENPPTILNFRLHNQQGSLKWIDIRNYGLSRWIEIGRESISSEHILGTLLDIITFLRTNRLGSLQATAASQSLHSLKYRFLRHSVHVNTNETANLLGSAALYGGRNECYRLGPIQGPVTQYDFNSLYPAVYSREEVPIRVRDIRPNPSDRDIASAINGKNCIARIMVDTDVPCLPKRIQGNLTFPVGRFGTAVCWPELELALETARHVRITEIGTYDMARALSEFAQALHPLRTSHKQRGNAAVSAYVKSLLVSLPGKFGQRNRRWQFSPNQKAPAPWHVWYAKNSQGKYGRHRSVAWYVEEEIDAGLGSEAVPEIAAWITSWGRRILWEEMCRVGREKVVYVDTDSLWTRGDNHGETIPVRGPDSERMGCLRLVDTYKQVTFHGLKHYIADGVSTPTVRTTNERERSVVSGGDPGLAGIAWYCNRGVAPTNPIRQPIATGCGEYTHGRVQPDLSVKPIELEEW